MLLLGSDFVGRAWHDQQRDDDSEHDPALHSGSERAEESAKTEDGRGKVERGGRPAVHLEQARYLRGG
jgi:hypothetical protein